MRRVFAKLRHLPRPVRITLAVLLGSILLVYYPVGMAVVHEIDDSPEFAPAQPMPEGASHAVAMAAALIDREVNRHYWTPNDPFFLPGAMLTRMPAFQRGIVSALGRFAIELSDQLGRTRGSSQADPDLQKSAGLLNYSPTVWVFDFSTSMLPTASSEKQFRSGMRALLSYNQRLASGHYALDIRADNLLETLERIASDLGSSSAATSDHVLHRSSLAFGAAADLYYFNKGRMYAYYLLLRELGKDYAVVIEEKQLQKAWAQLLESLEQGMGLSNFLIFNADPDSQFFPNHLASQGFFLLRARVQLREITNILLK